MHFLQLFKIKSRHSLLKAVCTISTTCKRFSCIVFTWIQCNNLPYQPNHPFPDCLFCSALSSICYHKGTCQLTSPVTTTMTSNLPIVSYKLYTHCNISPSLWYQPCTIVVVVQKLGNVWLDRETEKERDQLKVILTHHPIAPIPPQTFQTSIRSILARIKVFTVAFTVLDEKEIEKKKRVSKRKRRPDVKRFARKRTKNAKGIRFQRPPLWWWRRIT